MNERRKDNDSMLVTQSGVNYETTILFKRSDRRFQSFSSRIHPSIHLVNHLRAGANALAVLAEARRARTTDATNFMVVVVVKDTNDDSIDCDVWLATHNTDRFFDVAEEQTNVCECVFGPPYLHSSLVIRQCRLNVSIL
jgi:hypothetical protein